MSWMQLKYPDKGIIRRLSRCIFMQLIIDLGSRIFMYDSFTYMCVDLALNYRKWSSVLFILGRRRLKQYISTLMLAKVTVTKVNGAILQNALG